MSRQHKEMLSLLARTDCQQTLLTSLSAQAPALASLFSLDQSEMCAGGGLQQDVCHTDGGAPLVCQAQSGRWTVVGLLTWALGCDAGADQSPGVFLNINNVMDWIISVQ